MTAKEYLTQLNILNRAINVKLETLSQLESLVFATTKALSFDKIKSSNENTTEKYICSYIDLKTEIQEDIEKLFSLYREIEKTINSVDNEMYRLILELRYINFKTIEEIGEILNYSKRNINYLHKQALKVIEDKL